MMKRKIKAFLVLCCFACSSTYLNALLQEKDIDLHKELFPNGSHHVNFNDVSIVELIRFVSKISHVNFIFDHRELGFNVTLSSGKSVSSVELLKALVQLLRMHGFGVSEEENYFVIHRLDQERRKKEGLPPDQLLAGTLPMGSRSSSSKLDFYVYKLKYHQGSEIEMALKKIAVDLRSHPDHPQKLLEAIQSIQWVKTTNSLLFSADDDTIRRLNQLISSLDVPLRQVFIEVLVVETDLKKSMEFGLQWTGEGQYKNKIGFGAGNFPASGGSSLAKSVHGAHAANSPSGLTQIPMGRGFDLGIIGDIIFHKGKSFLTLGSLVSALQTDGDTTIVLNQKLVTQDNKNSKIFVGDNIPFTGSIVSTVGSSQQTTANIEYRDVGVSLNITPMLGEDEIVTLDISQEISEAVGGYQTSASEVEGIRTTKTNMATHAHVPDQHFLCLSGMVRNARSYQKSGLPCLGGLPVIGAAFSKTRKVDEKRHVLIFVRPHIINSIEDMKKINQKQEAYFDKKMVPEDFQVEDIKTEKKAPVNSLRVDSLARFFFSDQSMLCTEIAFVCQ